jgi:hypothetical protein
VQADVDANEAAANKATAAVQADVDANEAAANKATAAVQADVDANSTKINVLNDTLKNFVDLTTNQTVAGIKNFKNDININGIKVGKGEGSGRGNTAIGSNTLSYNTTGNHNSANSNYAMNKNTTGQGNTAVGSESLYANTTGSNNTAIGRKALENNESGSGNTAIGSNADVRSGNLTNATAIGSGAIVLASNTVQLGNSSVTNVKTSGTITTGSITLPNTDGAKDQVLTTDGSGKATWSTISTSASDVVIAKLANASRTIAKVGNLEFRYSSTRTNGFLEVRTVSGSMNAQAYCVKRSHDNTLTGRATSTNHYNEANYTSRAWSPLIALWDGRGYSDRVTLGTYITTHGTLHEMGNGRSLPSPGLYKFWATIDKYDHIVIKVEYIK